MTLYAKRTLIPLLLAMTLLLTSCAEFLAELERLSRPQPSDTIERLETALNDMDMKAVLDCFQPEFGKTVGFAMDLMGGIFGSITGVEVDFNTLMEIMPFLFQFMPEMDGVVKPSFALETVSTDYIDDNTATVTVSVTVTADGESVSEDVELTLRYRDGKWQIEVPKEVIESLMNF